MRQHCETYKFYRPSKWLVALFLCACSRSDTVASGDMTPKTSKGISMHGIDIVASAAGATRYMFSPGETHAVAELRGQWLHEEYGGRAGEVPGLLEVLGPLGEVVTAVHGWALGAPSDRGRLVFIEEVPHEYRYQVRSTESKDKAVPIELPPGYWHIEAALRPPGTDCAVALLWSPVPGHDWKMPEERRERLFLVSIDTKSVTVHDTRMLEATLPMLGGLRQGVGAAAGSADGKSMIAVIEIPEPDANPPVWHVTAMDCHTLETLWRVPVPVAATEPTPGPAGANERANEALPAVSVSRTAGDERVSQSMSLAFTGDGMHIVLAYGAAGSIAVDAGRFMVLSSQTGKLEKSWSSPAQPIHQMVPATGQASVVALHLERVRKGGGALRETTFFGVSRLGANGTVKPILEVSRAILGEHWKDIETMEPHALAVRRDGTLVLAPARFSWVHEHGPSGTWPQGSGTGAQSSEVAPWRTMPLDWHRDQRAAVQHRDAWMEAARKPAGTAQQ